MHSNTNIVWLRLFWALSKLFGYAPFNMNNQRIGKRKNLIFSTSRVGSIYNIFILIFLIIIQLFSIQKIRAALASLNNIDGLFVVCLASSYKISMAITLLIYIFRQKDIVFILNKLVQVDIQLYGKLINRCEQQSGKYQSLRIFILYLFTLILATSIDFIMIHQYQNSIIFVMAYFCCFYPLIQYTLILIYLQKSALMLNKTLGLLADFNNKRGFYTIQSQTIIIDLQLLRKIRINLYDISCKLSDFYSWTSLIPICCTYAAIIYRTYKVILNAKNWSMLYSVDFDDVAWIVVSVLPIICLTSAVTAVNAEVCINYYK